MRMTSRVWPLNVTIIWEGIERVVGDEEDDCEKAGLDAREEGCDEASIA